MQFKIIEQNIAPTQPCFNKEHKSLHSTQHITKITCLDACWFAIVVEQPTSHKGNEQHHQTQSMNTKLQLIPSTTNMNPTRPLSNHHEPPPQLRFCSCQQPIFIFLIFFCLFCMDYRSILDSSLFLQLIVVGMLGP